VRHVGIVVILAIPALLAPADTGPAHAIDPYAWAPWAIPTTGTVDQTFRPTDPDHPHEGIDILTGDAAAPAPGNPVFAAAGGTVVLVVDACGQDAGPGTGNLNPASRVIIHHPEQQVWSVYSHMADWTPEQTGCDGGRRSFVIVTVNQQVDQKTQIGWQGNCCPNDNELHITHLHFQVNRVASPQALGDRIDPTPFITGYLWPEGTTNPVPSGTQLTYNGGGTALPAPGPDTGNPPLTAPAVPSA
jgi:murein DD-endopeptidase MepM/ murein hydrolase activator NlpD